MRNDLMDSIVPKYGFYDNDIALELFKKMYQNAVVRNEFQQKNEDKISTIRPFIL